MAEIENNKSSIWLWLGIAIFVASIVSFYTIDQSTFTKTIILLVGAGVAVFVALKSEQGKKFVFFIQETKIELKKVFFGHHAQKQ